MALDSRTSFFPLEILRLIFNQCDIRTLKRLRLLNHAMETELNPKVFNTLHIDVLPQSLKATRMIAFQPTLAKHVQEIVISDNLLRSYTYEAFQRRLCLHEFYNSEWLGQRNDSPNSSILADEDSSYILSRDRCRQSFDTYHKYLRAQKGIVQNKAKFHSILSRLIRVERIRLKTLSNIKQSTYWTNFSIEVFGNIDRFSLRTWTTPLVDTGEKISALSMMIRNVHRLAHQVFSVHVDYIPCHCWHLPTVNPIYLTLKILDIRVAQGQSSQERTIVLTGLRHLIQNLGSVETLKLEITPSCGYFTRLDFGDIFSDVKLSMLQDLAFCTGIITSYDLLKIHVLHGETLRSFSIVDFHLRDSQWNNIYPLLTKDLRHSIIIFEGLTDGDGWTTHTALPFGETLTIRRT